MSLHHFIHWLRSRFWYLPLVYGLFACLFAYVSLQIDVNLYRFDMINQFLPDLLFSDLDRAETILSSISASLLTMTTITFSTILVVLTTYLSEFSPRALHNFITDRNTQRVLGVFSGGFIYTILLLLLLHEPGSEAGYISPAIAVVFAIVCLVVFIFFVHHVSSWIQVSNLIHTITLETMEKIEHDLSSLKEFTEDSPWQDWESGELTHLDPISLTGNQAGYIQDVDILGLVKQAEKDDTIVKVLRKVGEYVDQDTPILSIYTLEPHEIHGAYQKYISIGIRKIAYDNIEFGLTKLVEIALRALSPGVNDPNTAINGIDNLGKILSKLGKKHLPHAYHNDKENNLRVVYDKPSFLDYLYKSFYQIRQYGTNDISVLSSLLGALTLIAESNHSSIKKNVWEFTQYIIEGVDHQAMLSLDKQFINKKLHKLAQAAGFSKDYKPFV
ncbi:DUF2254 domain-containing protein [Thalassorhabdus alkalitolerans]|uniref:DUF2254 domain-containing protein n=1 Tax=Thalassorhabdus alkalitolerans TaxID=2282697 RepID=A0ABW0YLX9_9BACI